MNPVKNLIGVRKSDESKTNNDEFVAILGRLAHALSQPLTSLRGSVEVALMGELNEPECRKVLELVLQESHRLGASLETLREVLDLRDSSGEIQAVSWKNSIARVLKEVSSSEQNVLPGLVSSLEDDIWVNANPEQLDIATRKLIGGVVKASGGKEVIRVGLSVRGKAACLSVCCGYLPAYMGLIADEEQAPMSPALLEEGGLDWWIIRHAIERQGGWLNVSGKPETGLCFELNLPLASPKLAHQD